MQQFWEAIGKWFYSFLGIDLIMNAIENNEPIPAQGYVQVIFSSLFLFLGVLVAYKTIYILIGLFSKTKKYPEMPKDKKYAFIITAWNEELVIGNLIDSIRAMDYPQELIDIYVCADNCTDKTGEIAKERGAIVYYHNNPNERSKGYGLRYLVSQIQKDVDINEYYAFTTLDADNVPAPDYISKINNYLQSTGVDECIAYRNTKNLSENWISSMCGIQAFAHSLDGLRPRQVLGCNQEMYGPSTTLRSYLLKDGWKWVSLTEDIETLLDLTSHNYKTGFTEEAVFYEEQPTTLKLLWRQRIRWARGGLIAFNRYAWKMIKSFFKKPSWSKYDIFFQTFPYSFLVFWITAIYQITILALFFIVGDDSFTWMSVLNYWIGVVGGIYLGTLLHNTLVIIKEWKHILLPWYKIIPYSFLFPLYALMDPIFSAVSAFKNPEWKHIDHHFVKDGNELSKEEEKKKKTNFGKNYKAGAIFQIVLMALSFVLLMASVYARKDNPFRDYLLWADSLLIPAISAFLWTLFSLLAVSILVTNYKKKWIGIITIIIGILNVNPFYVMGGIEFFKSKKQQS